MSRRAYASVAGICLAAGCSGGVPHRLTGALVSGDSLFAHGQFAAARRTYQRELATQSAPPYQAHARLGTLALLDNDPATALRHFRQADRLRPDSAPPRGLAEAYYRLGDMKAASEVESRLGRAASRAKLEALAAAGPAYAARWLETPVRVQFVRTDPLPVVQASVNGSEPVNFIIDTGAGETILDPQLADRLHVRVFGADSGVFAAGRVGNYQHGVADSLRIGSLVVSNVPVHVQSTRSFALAAGGLRIDGVLGTGLFMRLTATLDYPSSELRLQRAGEAVSTGTSLPLWLAADHLMLVWGRVNDGDSTLMLVDTGLAGAAFTAPDTIFRAAGIDLASAPAIQGIGGAGAVTAKPVRLAKVQFGPVVRTNVPALAGVFPPALASQFGFPIMGLVSHELLRQSVVTFDFKDMKLVVQ